MKMVNIDKSQLLTCLNSNCRVSLYRKNKIIEKLPSCKEQTIKVHKICKLRLRPCQSNIISSSDMVTDQAFESLIKRLNESEEKIWTIVELFQLYLTFEGTHIKTTKQLSSELSKTNTSFVFLRNKGCVTVIGHERFLYRLAKNEKDSKIERNIEEIGKTIKEECLSSKSSSLYYNLTFNTETIQQSSSTTLLRLLGCISHRLNHTLPAYTIANLAYYSVTNQFTPMQQMVAIMLGEKKLIDKFSALKLTIPYKAFLNLRTSIAASSSNVYEQAHNTSFLPKSFNCKDGLVQLVIDNFDANIWSVNNKKSTHALATIMTQANTGDDVLPDHLVRKLTREESRAFMANLGHVNEQKSYSGKMNPEMPPSAASRNVLPLKVLVAQSISKRRANTNDFEFLKCIQSTPNETPEYNGFNTEKARNQGHSINKKSKTVFCPLIHSPPSSHATVQAALDNGLILTNKAGQEYVVYLFYRLALNLSVSFMSHKKLVTMF